MSAPIVVGVDASKASCDAVFWALSEAGRRRSSVLLLHAPDGADAEIASVSAAVGTRRAAAVSVLQAHRRHARRLAPEVETHALLAGEDAVHALVTASRRADLLVVGNRGRLGVAESALGSVSQRVAAHARCPVVVVPQGLARLVTRRVAVVVAGPGEVGDEVDFAAAQAQRWAATLAVLPDADTDTAWTTALLRERYPSVVVEVGERSGDVVPAVLAESARADLLVLPCRHTDAEFGCRIGALAASVLARSGCPVALIGHDGIGHGG